MSVDVLESPDVKLRDVVVVPETKEREKFDYKDYLPRGAIEKLPDGGSAFRHDPDRYSRYQANLMCLDKELAGASNYDETGWRSVAKKIKKLKSDFQTIASITSIFPIAADTNTCFDGMAGLETARKDQALRMIKSLAPDGKHPEFYHLRYFEGIKRCFDDINFESLVTQDHYNTLKDYIENLWPGDPTTNIGFQDAVRAIANFRVIFPNKFKDLHLKDGLIDRIKEKLRFYGEKVTSEAIGPEYFVETARGLAIILADDIQVENGIVKCIYRDEEVVENKNEPEERDF